MKAIDQLTVNELEARLLVEPLDFAALDRLTARREDDSDSARLERVLLRALLHIAENPDDDELNRQRDTLYGRLDEAKRWRSDGQPLRVRWQSTMQAKAYDEAWCLSAVMAAKGMANEKELKFYEKFRAGVRAPTAALTGEHFHDWFHPDVDLRVTALLSAVMAALRDVAPLDLRSFGVRPRRDELDPQTPLMFCRLHDAWAKVIGLDPVPKVYKLADVDLLTATFKGSTSTVVGMKFLDYGPRDMPFLLGRHLASQYPVLSIASILDLEGLRFVWRMIAAPELATPVGVVALMADTIRAAMAKHHAFRPDDVEWARSVGDDVDLETWVRGVDHTRSRLGLLMSGDVESAAAILASGAQPLRPTLREERSTERVEELLRFAGSDEFFRLRKHLGLDIVSGQLASPTNIE